MSKKKRKGRKKAGFMFIDFFMIVFCLSGAVIFFNKFRLDLFQTIFFRNEESAGLITIKHNTVQRRPRDRVRWDWLRNESPVYSGDLIRVADLSDATLHIAGNNIHLNENTSIRIRRSPDGKGPFQIDLVSGNLSLVAGTEGERVVVNLMDRQVYAKPGAVLNASAGENGMTVRVSEGAALFTDTEKKQSRELIATAMIDLDSNGMEREEPSIIVTLPSPNARYYKKGTGPLNVNFAWDRKNLRSGQTLHLEIAEDRNFNHIVRTVKNLDSTARAALNTGQWYWRLSGEDAVLGMGQFTVADAAKPVLINPTARKLFRFQTDPPLIHFQWSKVEDASAYILEVSEASDFKSPRIRRQIGVEYIIESNLGEGTWYWRVIPIFPSGYDGNVIPSSVSSFRIEQGKPLEEPLWPEPAAAKAPAKTPTTITKEPAAKAKPKPKAAAKAPPKPAVKAAPKTPPKPAAKNEAKPAAKTAKETPPKVAAETPPPPPSEAVAESPPKVVTETAAEFPAEAMAEEAPPKAAAEPVTKPDPELVKLQKSKSPSLGVPGNRLPPDGYRVTIQELKKTGGAIKFSWSAVPGANAYVFTLYQQIADDKRQQKDQRIINSTSWNLDNFNSLEEQGTFIWQVEAVNRSRDGKIQQWGKGGENFFIMDIPRSDPVQLKEPEIF